MTEEFRLIKKYPNRRLYDTATSSYITLADVNSSFSTSRLQGHRCQERRRSHPQHSVADHPRGRERRRADVFFRHAVADHSLLRQRNARNDGQLSREKHQTFIEIQRACRNRACPNSATTDAQRRSLEPVRKDARPDDTGIDVELSRAERQHLPRHATAAPETGTLHLRQLPLRQLRRASGRQQAGCATPTPTATINRRRKPAEAPMIVKAARVDDPAPFSSTRLSMTAVKTRKPRCTPRVGFVSLGCPKRGRFRANPHPASCEDI